MFNSLEDANTKDDATFPLVYAPFLKAHIPQGTSVLVDAQNDAASDEGAAEGIQSLMVARIVDISTTNNAIPPAEIENCKDSPVKVKVNILDRFDREMYRKTGTAKALTSKSAHVPEVYQTMDYIWVGTEKIMDIAFGLVGLLGNETTFGSRQPWPRLRDGVKPLCKNHGINVLQTVNFVYDGGCLNLTVTFKAIVALERTRERRGISS